MFPSKKRRQRIISIKFSPEVLAELEEKSNANLIYFYWRDFVKAVEMGKITIDNRTRHVNGIVTEDNARRLKRYGIIEEDGRRSLPLKKEGFMVRTIGIHNIYNYN